MNCVEHTKNRMMVVVCCHYGHTGLCRFTVKFCILIIMLFFAASMAGLVSDSHVLASFCVCVVTFLHSFLIFPHMKSAHFSWSFLFLCSLVLQPDPVLLHINFDFPLFPVWGCF